jgi:hypothetical protein
MLGKAFSVGVAAFRCLKKIELPFLFNPDSAVPVAV